MAKKFNYGSIEVGLSLEGANYTTAHFALHKNGMRVWITGGELATIPEKELLALLRELIKLYPLNALGSV